MLMLFSIFIKLTQLQYLELILEKGSTAKKISRLFV